MFNYKNPQRCKEKPVILFIAIHRAFLLQADKLPAGVKSDQVQHCLKLNAALVLRNTIIVFLFCILYYYYYGPDVEMLDENTGQYYQTQYSPWTQLI